MSELRVGQYLSDLGAPGGLRRRHCWGRGTIELGWGLASEMTAASVDAIRTPIHLPYSSSHP